MDSASGEKSPLAHRSLRRMIERLRRLIRGAGLAIAHAIGTRLVDFQTGRPLGRALVIAWRGKIHIIGLSKPVRPAFLPQKRITYWKQDLGFTLHPPPDFPRETGEPARRHLINTPKIKNAETG
jgi:hypothetical protein